MSFDPNVSQESTKQDRFLFRDSEMMEKIKPRMHTDETRMGNGSVTQRRQGAKARPSCVFAALRELPCAPFLNSSLFTIHS